MVAGDHVDLRVSLAYGRSVLTASIPEWAIAEIVRPKEWTPVSENDVLETAFREPIGLPRLRELARGCRTAVIVTCDKTRGVPSRATIPFVLSELREEGLDLKRVKVLVATGLHKDETSADVKERLGSGLVENLRVEIHESDDRTGLVELGELSSGIPLQLNRTVIDSDLVVIESAVEPHFFAGFTGGSKVILPGVAGTETVLGNHSAQNIDHSRSRYGTIDNPIRAEADEALHHLKRVYALNIVLDSQKHIVYATSGDPIASFNVAAKKVAVHSNVRIDRRPDVVIVTNGGYPLDRNVYQCVKGIAVPESILHQGSRIVMVAECSDGVAHEEFLTLLSSDKPDVTYEKLRRRQIAARDQWQVQVLCRILRNTPVTFVTRSEVAPEIESMHMRHAHTVEEALKSVDLRKGEYVLVIPEGPSTVPTV